MFDKIKESIHQAGEAIKEQASAFGDAAKEKAYQLIDQWISNLPALEAYGLKVNYFSVGVSISPTLEVELIGKPGDFPPARIEAIMAEHTTNRPLSLVFSTILTTYKLHRKAKIEFNDPLSVKIHVGLSPEIKVAYGKQHNA